MSFVHLHLHTQFSLLDGAIRLKDLFARAKQYKMPAVAITDHGNMFGAIKFYKAAKAAGIKPIIGSEVYVAPLGREDRTERKSYHLILLAKDLEGYHNLCRVSSIGFTEGFYYVPRIDMEVLRTYSKGLICLTGCLGGEVPQAILKGDLDHALKTAKEYDELFGRDNYYLELQHNGIPEQEKVNAGLLSISEQTGIPVVATNDCHYLDQEHAEAHEVLMAIQTGKTIDSEKRMSHTTQELYFKSPEVMRQQFKGLEHALDVTEKIAAMTDLHLSLDEPKLPRFQPPEGQTLEDFLKKTTNEGLQRRLIALGIDDPEQRKRYQERLDLELGVIIDMGFAGYFLIVWDFIKWSKENDIPVGPGRGSGAGSLAAYSLEITDIDPIQYGLLFERFLNPERVSMPDFDIDFCKDKRDRVIEYVIKKYGSDRVGQIVTLSSLNARGVLKDVGRALGMSFGEVDQVTKLVPAELGIDLETALKKEPKLRAIRGSEPRYGRLFEVSLVLEGLHRHAGVHAAGIVIGQEPLMDICPLKTNDGDVVTQFAKDEAEAVGLVKFDFLGLKTLTVLDVALGLIRQTTGEELDLLALPMDDPDVYKLISSAETTGVFQMESSGFRDLLRRLRPDTFEDIIAALALYRPGPLEAGMVDQYVRRKNGEEAVTYFHPDVKDILKETYGVVVYQEQVMQISTAIAGYSLGRADILRKAMGKKKKAMIDAERVPFVEAAVERGHKRKEMEGLFETLEAFARYGFNKSHSAAYALVTFQTAYIKAHYPVEFICAQMTCDMGNTDKMIVYVADAKRLGIPVLVPDINRSSKDFSVVDGEILLGLGGVKNVGSAAIDVILEERDAEGPFTSFFDFCMRVDLRRVNKRVVESLVYGGAFEVFGVNRARIEEHLETALAIAQRAQKQKATGQLALFGGGGVEDESYKDPLEDERGKCMDRREKKWALQKEKENLGFYLSAHPLDALKAEIQAFTSHSIQTVKLAPDNRPVRLAGVVSGLKAKLQKNGGRMGRFTLEDQEGFIEVMVFSKAFDAGEETLRGDEPVLIEGTVMVDGEGENTIHRIRAEKILTFPEVRMDLTRRIRLRVAEGTHDGETLACLRDVMKGSEGEVPVMVLVDIPGSGTAAVPLGNNYRIQPDEEWVYSTFRILGAGGVVFDKKTPDEWLNSTPRANSYRRGAGDRRR